MKQDPVHKEICVPMTFPDSIYLHEAVSYLAEYSWIYEFKLTNIFTTDVLNKIPKQWIEALLNITNDDLNKVPYGFINEDWPYSLKKFFKKSTELAKQRFLNHEWNKFEIENIRIPDYIKRGMAPKKITEVQYASALIADICKQAGLSTVVDVGSGLGYLDQVLHHNFGLVVVGIDNVQKRSDSAKERVTKGPCTTNIHHFTETISSDGRSLQAVFKMLQDTPRRICKCGNGNKYQDKQDFEKSEGENDVIMIGLHCCGDLLPNMLKHFISLPKIQGLVCIGCCYHLMSHNGQCFDNFPMSHVLCKTMKTVQLTYPQWQPSTNGLRLASQETRARWAEQSEFRHKEHSRHVAYRGILQLLFEKEGIKWKKPRRRLARKKKLSSFETYVQVALQDFKWTEKIKEERMQWLFRAFEKYKHLMPVIEILTLFQVLMQPVWEAVITLDRYLFMKENNIYVHITNPFDEYVSPRNLALICTKKIVTCK